MCPLTRPVAKLLALDRPHRPSTQAEQLVTGQRGPQPARAGPGTAVTRVLPGPAAFGAHPHSAL